MKTPKQDIDYNQVYQVANDMQAYATLLQNMDSDPSGTISLTSEILRTWASKIIDVLEVEGQSN